MADAEKDAVAETHSERFNQADGMAQLRPFVLPAELEVAQKPLLALEDVSVKAQPNGADGGHAKKKLKKSTSDKAKDYLPGQPRQPLDGKPAWEPERDLLRYIQDFHTVPDLDKLLWWMQYIFVQTPSFRHIMPLHHQEAHARTIMVDHQPGLHLLWHYERIFVQPIPAYFYEPSFWDYLNQDGQDYEQLRRNCLGFMRSWSFLVQHEIDFDVACKKKLIPKKPDGEMPTWEQFAKFINVFAAVKDGQVNFRYTFGELRLTRVNRTAMLTWKSLAYFHIHMQWGSFLAHILAPVITIFAIFSVVLEAMQVQLNAQQIFGGSPGPSNDTSLSTSSSSTGFTPTRQWEAFNSVSLYFPVVVLTVIAVILGATGLGFIVMAFKDLIGTARVRKGKRRNDPKAGVKTHGIIW